MLTFSEHKMYGPKGIGALYVNQKIKLSPILYGGGQERSRRPGTENLAGIVGFGKACEICMQEYTERDRIKYLRDKLENSILDCINYAVVHGKNAVRLPNTISISFPGVEAEALVLELDRQKIAVSMGIEYGYAAIEPSHVLLAMGLPYEQLSSTIRISLGRYTKEEEVLEACQIISSSVIKIKHHLHEINPL